MRSSLGGCKIGVVAVLLACFWCLLCARPAATEPKTAATLAIGAAQRSSFFHSGSPYGAMAELKLRATGADIGAFVEARHSFYDDDYLDRKSKLKAGLEAYVAPRATLFATWERAYRTGDEWGFAGIRFNLGR